MYNDIEFITMKSKYKIYKVSKCPEHILNIIKNNNNENFPYVIIWNYEKDIKQLGGGFFEKSYVHEHFEDGSWEIVNSDPIIKDLLKVLEEK